MTDDQIKELREKAQTVEAAFPGKWYSIGPHAVQLYCNGDVTDDELVISLTPLVLGGIVGEKEFNGDYELFCEYAVMVQPSVIRKLLRERDLLLDAARVGEQRGMLLKALEGVVRVADRNTDEFDAARDAIAMAKGEV